MPVKQEPKKVEPVVTEPDIKEDFRAEDAEAIKELAFVSPILALNLRV